MSGSRRNAYLDAMGIRRWLRRGVPRSAGDEPVDEASIEGAVAAAPRGAEAQDRARELEALRERVSGCTACPLHEGRSRTVFGVGDPDAELMVVGEAPGVQEDRQGEPFVGRAGALLDEMLRALGTSRGDRVFITNIVKCRPPQNRDPRPEEADACAGYLGRQLELIAPRVILAVGRVAAQRLLATQAPLGRLRGQVHRYGEDATPVVVSYHPAYLLRSPQDKRKAWGDLKLVLSELGERSR